MRSEGFDTTDDTDIILRSADGQQFRTHKNVLSRASPVFRDMFAFPQPPSPEPSSIPVVDVSETGKVLDVFLQCLYPMPKTTVEGFELLEGVFTAGEKYEATVVLNHMGGTLSGDSREPQGRSIPRLCYRARLRILWTSRRRRKTDNVRYAPFR